MSQNTDRMTKLLINGVVHKVWINGETKLNFELGGCRGFFDFPTEKTLTSRGVSVVSR